MTNKPTPNASYSLTLRVRIHNQPGKLGEITTAIGRAGGDIEGIDIVSVGKDFLIRDITVNAASETHDKEIVASVERHRRRRGRQCFRPHVPDAPRRQDRGRFKDAAQDASRSLDGIHAGRRSRLRGDPQGPGKAFNLTIKKNTVAVVSDGTAVLGLGDIGPAAAMPVMEGKCQLFKEFGGVDAFPICLNTKDPHEIVQTIKNISVAFGGINLEDISAPRCFEIEDRLKEELDIPVFHDDQHGTAVVVLAALINALKIVGKRMEDIKVVVNGIGAAGVACSKIVMAAGVKNIVGCDHDRRDLRRPQRKYELGQGLVRPQHQPGQRKRHDPRRDQRRRCFLRSLSSRRDRRQTISRIWRRTRSFLRWQIRCPRSCPKTLPDTSP